MRTTSSERHGIAPVDDGRARGPGVGDRAARERRLRAAIEVLRGMDDDLAAPGLRRAVGDLERRLDKLRSTAETRPRTR